MKLDRPVRLPAAVAPGLVVLLFHVNPASLKTAGSLVVLLAAAATTAAGLTVAVGRLRLRPRPPVRAPGVRAVPDPGPPDQVDIHDAGPADIATIKEGPALPDQPPIPLDSAG